MALCQCDELRESSGVCCACDTFGGFHEGTPQKGKLPLEWMITRGTPILGHHHLSCSSICVWMLDVWRLNMSFMSHLTAWFCRGVWVKPSQGCWCQRLKVIFVGGHGLALRWFLFQQVSLTSPPKRQISSRLRKEELVVSWWL